jgi:hypothetical protein
VAGNHREQRSQRTVKRAEQPEVDTLGADPQVAERTTGTKATLLSLQRAAGNAAVQGLLGAGGDAGIVRRKDDKSKSKSKSKGKDTGTVEGDSSTAPPSESEQGLIDMWLQLIRDGEDPFALSSMIKGRSRELKAAFMVQLTRRGEATGMMANDSWVGFLFHPWVTSLPKSDGLTKEERAVVDFLANGAPATSKTFLQTCVLKLYGIDVPLVAAGVDPDGDGVKRLLREVRQVPDGERADHVRIWLLVESIRKKGKPSAAFTSFLELSADKRDVALTRILDDPAAAPTFALVNYSINFHQPYLANLPRGGRLNDVQKRFLAVAFTAAGDGLPLLTRIFEKRFDLKLGRTDDDTGADWDARGLKRMYPALDTLPQAHVERNKWLIEMNRYQPTSGISGWYSERSKESAIGYAATSDLDNDTENTAGDPLHGKNSFDATVRHEVGHAVDRQLGWSRGKGPEESARGGWHDFGTSKSGYVKLVADMVEKSGAGLAALPTAAKKAAVKDLAETAYKGGANLTNLGDIQDWMEDAIQQAGEWDDLDPAQQQAARNDPVITALSEGRHENNPWFEPGGGVPLNGYLYERSYGFTGWYRYEAAARARKVSEYQFRHPGEWFAEAYAAYYDPQPDRGATLAESDPDTKRWFDEKVHPMKVSR